MKTDEVCGRPLDPFAVHTRVSWFCMLHGDERYTKDPPHNCAQTIHIIPATQISRKSAIQAHYLHTK